MKTSSPSLVVAVDHPLMRLGIRDLLASDQLYGPINLAATGAECIALLHRHRPDVAIIDVRICDPGVTAIVSEARIAQLKTRICLLTEDRGPPSVLKDENTREAVFVSSRFPQDLRDKLREIASSCRLANDRPADLTETGELADTEFHQQLTTRQHQIVSMLKIGSSNKTIANALGLSEGTVKLHLHRIYQRTGIANRTQLAARSLATE